MLCPAILLFLSTSLGYHVALCVSPLHGNGTPLPTVPAAES